MTLKQLLAHNPCEEGSHFARSAGSVHKAWQTCTRIDWMLWFVGKLPNSKALLISFAESCMAEIAQKLDMPGWSSRLIPMEDHKMWGCFMHYQHAKQSDVPAIHVSLIAVLTNKLVGGDSEVRLCDRAREHFRQLIKPPGSHAFGEHDTTESNKERWDMTPDETHWHHD